MRPNRYLGIAGIAVLMSWCAIIGLVYSSAGELRQQRGQYDELTQQLLSLEQMRASVVQLAAADDEFMILAAIKGIGDPRFRAQLKGDHAAQLAASKNSFANAFSRYQKLNKFNATPVDPAQGPALSAPNRFVEYIRAKYSAYIVASERLYLAGAEPGTKLIGEAKSLEKTLVREIGAGIGEVKQHLGNQHPLFEATITDARDKLLKLMLLTIIPALVTVYLALRGITKMFAEISTHKEEISRSNANLESALAELRSVQDAMMQTERLSTLGKLTATVSHELRNPMAAIRNSLFLIREFAGQREKVNSNVDRAERSIARCDNIIGDLLEYTRHRNLNLQPASLQAFVREIIDEQKLPAEIKLVTDLRGSEAKVMVDLDRFQRVVINLVQNAAEAIKVSKGFGEIKVQTGLIGDNAFLEIADDGPGMSEEVVQKIFEPLFTTKSFGAGLGLPTAKQLVEQHAGKISVNSEPGVGSSFRVTLPLAAAKQGRAA